MTRIKVNSQYFTILLSHSSMFLLKCIRGMLFHEQANSYYYIICDHLQYCINISYRHTNTYNYLKVYDIVENFSQKIDIHAMQHVYKYTSLNERRL